MASLFARLRASSPFFLIAGPNVIESEAHCVHMATRIKVIRRAAQLATFHGIQARGCRPALPCSAEGQLTEPAASSSLRPAPSECRAVEHDSEAGRAEPAAERRRGDVPAAVDC